MYVLQVDTPASTPLGSASGVSFLFADDNSTAPDTDFTVTIEWGDGQVTAPSFSRSISVGTWAGSDSHTYATPGPYIITLTVDDVGGSSAVGYAQTTITAPASLSASGMSLTGVEGAPFSGQVASFTDPETTLTADAFAALIDWGDGFSATARGDHRVGWQLRGHRQPHLCRRKGHPVRGHGDDHPDREPN